MTSSQSEQARQDKSEVTGQLPALDSDSLLDPVNSAMLPPMTSKQKFRYAVGNSISPLAFIEAAGKAGFYQQTGFRKKYGSGASGYFKQFGASWTDAALRNMTGSYLYASVLHEDPRYYRMGQGGFVKRLGYAFSRTLVTRSDSNHQVFNWASVLGSTTSAGLANFYLPANDRTVSMALGDVAWFLAGTAMNNAIQEFMPKLYSQLSKHP